MKAIYEALIPAGGDPVGISSGGCLEADVIEQARAAPASGGSQLLSTDPARFPTVDAVRCTEPERPPPAWAGDLRIQSGGMRDGGQSQGAG